MKTLVSTGPPEPVPAVQVLDQAPIEHFNVSDNIIRSNNSRQMGHGIHIREENGNIADVVHLVHDNIVTGAENAEIQDDSDSGTVVNVHDNY